MTLQQLRDLLAVVEAGSFTATAGPARRTIAAGPGNLCLAVGPSVPAQLVAGALARWAQGGRPDRAVRWHEYDGQERVEGKARSGVGTVGLGLRPLAWDGPVADIGADELVVAAPPDDPLAARDEPVPLATLAGRRWIGIDRERDAAGAAVADRPWTAPALDFLAVLVAPAGVPDGVPTA